MRWFVLGDIHDDLEALARACDYISANGADRVVVLGDILLRPYAASDWAAVEGSRDPGGSVPAVAVQQFIEAVWAQSGRTLLQAKTLLDKTGVPYDVLPGNYDIPLEPYFRGAVLHGASCEVGQIRMAGYGGAGVIPQHLAPLDELLMITPYADDALYSLLSVEDPDIIALHTPPYGLCDIMYDGSHSGSPAAARLVAEKKPEVVLCGHIHEAGPLAQNPARVGGLVRVNHPGGLHTYVVNPGNLGRFELVRFPTLETALQMPFGTFACIEMDDDGRLRRLDQFLLSGPDRSISDVRLLDRYLLGR